MHRTRTSLATVLAIFAIGCSSGEPQLTVSGAQAAEPVSGSSQLVLTITNDGDGDDRLVGVETDAAVGVEIHETRIEDGRATMQERGEVVIPAGQRVAFRPGGLHLMIIAPDDDVELGGTFPVTLQFDRSPPITLEATVVELLDLAESRPDDVDDASEVPS